MSDDAARKPLVPRVAGVSWRALFFIVAVACTAGAAGAWWVLDHFALQLQLHNQRLNIQLPPSMQVQVDILGKNQGDTVGSLPVQLDDTLDVMVSIDTLVPLHMTVPLKKSIPVKGMMPLDTIIHTRILGFPVSLPVQGTVPVDFMLPLDMAIPIDQSVRVHFKAPVKAHIKQQLRVPLPSNQAMQIRFRNNSIPITLQSGKLVLPFASMGLQRPAEPQSR